MFKKIVLLSIFLNSIIYQLIPGKSINNTITVNLDHKSFDDDFYLDQDYYYITLGLTPCSKYPNYNKHLKENYQGIPENDSVSFYSCFKDNLLTFDLNKLGDIATENLNGVITAENIDTLNYSKVKLKSTIVAVIGFFKNKQFIVADGNRNKDFSDDIKYEYDINFRNNPYKSMDFLNKLPITEYTFENCYQGNIQTYNRRFIIYPNRENPFSEYSKTNPKKEKEYFSILKFRDYWKGETTINNKIIEFYYHGYSNTFGILYVKPKEIAYRRNSSSFESQYMHKYYSNSSFDDTLTIEGKRYKIDSINREISKLYLREVGEKKRYGNQIDDYVKNIDFKDLQNKSFKTDDIIGKKKYTLIDFWGTWCGPCIALTPNLKDAHKKYSTTLNIISVAVDNDRKIVKKYIDKHKITWKIGYLSKYRNWENPIIKQLKVGSFPTFFLLDSKGKIIYIASSDNLDDLLKRLK